MSPACLCILHDHLYNSPNPTGRDQPYYMSEAFVANCRNKRASEMRSANSLGRWHCTAYCVRTRCSQSTPPPSDGS